MIKVVSLLFLVSALGACEPAAQTFDTLIVGGTIYDGSLGDGREGNIGIRDGRITTLDAASDALADLVIDASGLIVVPGFIDPHTHAMPHLSSREHNANLNYLAQGVTTVFVGNDGGGLPGREKVLTEMQQRGIGSNVAFFSGHGAIREEVMGSDNRAPTAAELHAMQTRVADDMTQGALGLSTGLYYVPGNYATTDEVIALARVAAEHGGVYDTHLRDESSYNIGLLAAVEETIAIARAADIPVHISHIKALGKDAWGQARAVIELIDDARTEGLSVTANQYPWQASGTRFSAALIPRWALAGDEDDLLARLDDTETGPRIREEMHANLGRRGGSDALLVTAASSRWHGDTLADIATQLELGPVEAAIAVVLSENPSIASFVMRPEDIALFAVQPWVMTGSDGSSGHPRLYGSYPKAWQDFVAGGLISISQFVHRSSGLVADTFTLCERGYLREGHVADVAIIDPAEFVANASYEQPTLLADGVRYLLISGVLTIDDRQYTGALPGRVLRHGDCAQVLQ